MVFQIESLLENTFFLKFISLIFISDDVEKVLPLKSCQSMLIYNGFKTISKGCT